jgi:drug/metabolite transporter (DMT)-like permease
LLLPIWLLGPISPITPANLPLILYAALPTSLLAPFCWMIGIARLGAARTALFINLLPIVVAALAWATLGEQLHTNHAIGGGLALIGVAIGLWEANLLTGGKRCLIRRRGRRKNCERLISQASRAQAIRQAPP